MAVVVDAVVVVVVAGVVVVVAAGVVAVVVGLSASTETFPATL